jgi:hypothetical protein
MSEPIEVNISPKKFITITLLFVGVLVTFAFLGSNALSKYSR